MYKFLQIIESSDPENENHDLTILKSICKMCEQLGYNCELDGSTLTIRIPEEEGENIDIDSTIAMATKIANIPDQSIGKQLMSPAARKLQLSKRIIADTLVKATEYVRQNIMKMSDNLRNPQNTIQQYEIKNTHTYKNTI